MKEDLVRGSKLKIAVAALVGGTATAAALQAHAGDSTDSDTQVQEVVITAQKRISTLQDTPGSIVAISGDELQARGTSSLAALAQGTPGVSLKSEGPSQTEIEMRGMTSSGGNSATVGFYLDDVPLTGPASAQNGHVVIDPDLYDLSRIEVLRGPQGTLFGSGSMGGTVRLITNQPNLSKFQLTAQSVLSGTQGGGLNHTDNSMLNIPLVSDTLALRIVGTENYTSGWIDRIVADPFPLATQNSTVRGNVQDAPVARQYPGSNAYQMYAARATLLWKPTENLTVTPSFFHETSRQEGISAFDSDPGTLAHYQPFDIAEPLTDEITIYSLNINYSFPWFDLTSSSARWLRNSSQVQEASEAFNSPVTGVTYTANNGLPNPGFYGPGGSGPEYGLEVDPSRQFSEELRLTSKDGGPLTWVAGLYYSRFQSLWTFAGTTPNFSAYTDLGTFQPATTPSWFAANSPTTLSQYAAFGDVTYALTDQLKADVGIRFNHYDYLFSSCIGGWGSALGAATPSCTGDITQSANSFTPRVNLSYTFSPDLMVYGNVAEGFRPGGGNAIYPTTGPVWGAAFAAMHYTGDKWPSTYSPDSVWSYEIGEKARLFDRRLTVNASIYYENWRHIQLEAYPDDWALNINGNRAQVYGAEVELLTNLGKGFIFELSGGYLHETLNSGPHWDIPPVNVLPEVAPVSGTVALSYSTPIVGSNTFTARVENTYTGRRYSLDFPVQNEATGAYVPMSAYHLTNVRAGIQFGDTFSVTLFVNNVANKHAQLESMFGENLPATPFTRIETNQPRTAGVDLSLALGH
jgi:outer membrane receptor protein involved in Fe transport